MQKKPTINIYIQTTRSPASENFTLLRPISLKYFAKTWNSYIIWFIFNYRLKLNIFYNLQTTGKTGIKFSGKFKIQHYSSRTWAMKFINCINSVNFVSYLRCRPDWTSKETWALNISNLKLWLGRFHTEGTFCCFWHISVAVFWTRKHRAPSTRLSAAAPQSHQTAFPVAWNLRTFLIFSIEKMWLLISAQRTGHVVSAPSRQAKLPSAFTHADGHRRCWL